MRCTLAHCTCLGAAIPHSASLTAHCVVATVIGTSVGAPHGGQPDGPSTTPINSRKSLACRGFGSQAGGPMRSKILAEQLVHSIQSLGAVAMRWSPCSPRTRQSLVPRQLATRVPPRACQLRAVPSFAGLASSIHGLAIEPRHFGLQGGSTTTFPDGGAWTKATLTTHLPMSMLFTRSWFLQLTAIDKIDRDDSNGGVACVTSSRPNVRTSGATNATCQRSGLR